MEEENKDYDAVGAHLKQWQETAKRIREQFAPIIKYKEVIKKSMQPIFEAQKALQKSLEPVLAEQERWRKLTQSIQIPKIDLPNILHLTKPIIEYQKTIQGFINPAFEQLQKSFKELPSRTKEALLLLGEHGWFLDLEMPLPALWQLRKALTDGSVEEAEEALIEYFNSRLSEIEQSIIEKYPGRKKIIEAAFNAHHREEYELSIPVLLSQIDGICKDTVKQYLFMKKNKKPRTAIYVEQVASDTYRKALLSPLSQTLPIGASEHERSEDFNELNRHMVLHGESLDYGTKTNSLKAISLINYVAHVLKLDKENP